MASNVKERLASLSPSPETHACKNPLTYPSLLLIIFLYIVEMKRREMPTVLRSGPYRLYFFSHETTEPPHIHIDRDHQTCKFWLKEVALARNLGFSAKELRDIEVLVIESKATLLEAWYEYFGH